MLTALAIVTANASGRVIPGVACYLRAPSLPGGFLYDVTNNDGYAVFNNVPVPFSGVLKLSGPVQAYGDGGNGEAVAVSGQSVTLRVGPTHANPQDILLPACVPFKKPFQAAPRFWKGNMCGVRVPGLPSIDGGSADASLVLSWFYDRYNDADRSLIRQAWKARGYTHWLLSWADSRVFGRSPQQFSDTCRELIADGFFPCPWLASKAYDPPDVQQVLANIAPIVPLLQGVLPLACIGGELNLWLNPTQVQELIDALCPLFTPAGTRMYVHFSEGYAAYQQDGQPFSAFWNLNVGKLTGVLHQKVLSQSPDAYYYDSGGLVDILERFAGNVGVVPDSGFGHPFDLVAMEITAQLQFNGDCTEAEGDALGSWALNCPPQNGPAGLVGVQGSGNGIL